MFITFEGVDQAGKSTQCMLLGKYLKDSKYNVLVLREPGGTKISEKIREIILDIDSEGMVGLSEFFLYSAARAQLVESVIKPALAEKSIVVCDRFADSSTAYQGYARGLGAEKVESINAIAVDGLEPDLTFFIDIPVEESLRRLMVTEKIKDRLESESSEFFNRVRDGYLQIATKSETSQNKRFKVINGLDDINTIERRIREIVDDKLK